MKKMNLSELKYTDSRLLPAELGDGKIVEGGIYIFKPGETAHPEAIHTHDVPEIFIFLQGKGALPINGKEYPIKTGEVCIVEPGEDHHLRSSVEDPLVTAWYLVR